MPLADALRQGVVSVDALLAQAREDSQGDEPLCREIQRTMYGVTTFVYRYSDYELYFTRDGYQTPTEKSIFWKVLPLPTSTVPTQPLQILPPEMMAGL